MLCFRELRSQGSVSLASKEWKLESYWTSWDGVHAAATIDAGLRNPKKAWAELFAWLNEITNIIYKANRFHNWGMEWDRFFRTCQGTVEEGYDLKCKVPKFFSATKFANYAVKIYTRFR